MSSQQTTAIVLAGLMVLSLVALGGASATEERGPELSTQFDGSVDAGTDANERPSETSLGESGEADESTDGESGYVDPSLEAVDGTQQVLIQLEGTDVRLNADGATATDSLKAQAERTQEPVLAELERMDGLTASNSFWISNVIVAEADTGAVAFEQVADLENVEAVFLSREVELPEPAETEGDEETAENTTYGLDQINVPSVWDDFGVQGEGARVAVIDNGLDPSHPDIDLYTDDPDDPTYPGGFEVFDRDGEPVDGAEPGSADGAGAGHGDHTSATATGGDANGTSIGVAPEAELIHGDVFRESGTDATVIGAIEWAVENDADVVSMSLGFGCADPFQPEPAYVDSLIEPVENARAAETAMVISTGNAGEDCVGAPGNHFDSYGIGATDENGDVTYFSSGNEIEKDNWEEPPADWPETFVKPDVVAPGDDVLSADANGDGYVKRSGTSMSAPHVSGAVALLRSLNPDATVEEIEAALNETAEKPDDWLEPGDERDPRYGLGIVDVRAAMEEIDAEVVLGDVSAGGEVGAADVEGIRQASVGNEPEGVFIDDRADLTRDGEITLSDVILAEQKAAGQTEDGSLAVSDLDAPDEIDGGDTGEVTATITNDEPVGTLEYVELRLADDETELDETATIDRAFVDVAAAGVSDPSDRPAESTISFELDTSDLSGDDYAYEIATNDDESQGSVTVREPVFDVTDVDSPDEVDQGETISVTAEITNTGNDAGETDLEYRLVNDIDESELSDVAEGIDLEAGDSTEITFDVDTSEIDGGAYVQELSTADDTVTAGVTVNEQFFAVTDVDGPETVFADETYDVNATIENVGDAPDEQSVAYDLRDLDVAVVDVADEPEQGQEIVDVLDEDDRFETELLHAEDLEDSMDEYDGFVIQRLGSNETAETFYDGLENQGVVYLDSFQGLSSQNWADGVYRLHDVLENPAERGEVSTDSDGEPAELEIESAHPVFDGVGDEGDVVEMFDDTSTDNTWGAWFEEYDGDELATIDFGNGYGGTSVAVNDEGNELLLTAAGRSGYTDSESFTPEADRLLSNSVEYVLTGGVTPASAASETVSLEPGESETVQFEHAVPSDHETGDALHVVSTADAIGGGDVTVLEDDYFEVTAVEAPETANQTETISVTATVENAGLEAGTQDVDYVFDGEVVDSEPNVSLEVGESTTIEFEHTVDDYETPGELEHAVQTEMGEYAVPLEILEIDDAFFDVSVVDAPETVDQFDEITVTADVENTGDREATQTVEYEFTPYSSVAVVDDDPTTHGVDDLATDLDAELGEEVTVETLAADDLLAEMDEYDVFVVNHFGGTDVAAFLDALEENQGTIYVDQGYDDGANAIGALAEERDDLDQLEEGFSGSPTFYDIETDHPVFDGLGTEGETVDISDSGVYLEFDSYGGDSIAGVGAGAETVHNPGVGVDDAANEVLLGAHGLNGYNSYDDYLDDGLPVLANAVEHVAGQTVSETADVEATESIAVTLEGGESDTVEFETTIPLSADSGSYLHTVESANDDDAVPFEVDEEVTAIEGTVTDEETDEPIEGATVSITGDGDYETETDANGEYFVEVEPGNYVVDADADGYSADEIVTLEDGDVETVDFELAAIVGDIVGTVTDEEGVPIENATVSDADGNAFAVETNADGEYAVEDLSSGTYALEADADGYEPSDIEFVEVVPDGEAEQDFELAEDLGTIVEVSDLEPETSTIEEGEPITVSATVTNTIDEEVNQTIEFRIDGDEFDNESVTLAPSGTDTVEFVDVDTGGLGPGEYEHGVFSDDGEQTGTLTVDGDPELESIDLELGEGTLTESETTDATVTATYADGSSADVTDDAAISSANETVATVNGSTVEAVGDGVVDIEAEYESEGDEAVLEVEAADGGTTVAVVDDDPTTHGVEDAASALNDRLGDEDHAETLAADSLLEEMSGYDVLVVNNFGEADVGQFLDQLGDDQGVVYTDAYDDGANSITALSTERGNPAAASDEYDQSDDIAYRITADHPIFDGVGSEGDDVVLHTDIGMTTFSGYEGELIADVGAGIPDEGPGVGVDDDENEVLLGGHGLTGWAEHGDYTDDANAILANAVGHVADQAALETGEPTAASFQPAANGVHVPTSG